MGTRRSEHNFSGGTDYNGVFTRALIAGLEGEASDNDGNVTSRSLREYLAKTVPHLIPNSYHPVPHIPVFEDVLFKQGQPLRRRVVIESNLFPARSDFVVFDLKSPVSVLEVVRHPVGGNKIAVDLKPWNGYHFAIPEVADPNRDWTIRDNYVRQDTLLLQDQDAYVKL